MSGEKPQTKAAQREATIQRLIEVGRAMFAEHGYADTATETLVARAGVTRGALYHHFENKEGLFKAVLESVQNEVAARIEADVSQTDNLWEQLRIGCRTFLAASLDAHVGRIMLIDAPAVVGWETWRAMDAATSMKSLRELLNALIEAGIIVPQPLDALTHLLSGAMNEAALWITRSEQPTQALEEAVIVLNRLLDSLRR